MKRLLLAGLLVLPFALSRTGARADPNDAYGSLIGMADSASSDRGPEAGDIPPDRPDREEERSVSDAPEAAKTDSGAPVGVRLEAKPVVPKRERAKPSRDDDAPSVAVPAAAAPRVWTKMFAALLPPATRTSAFEVAVSTTARRPLRDTARPATAASAAGSAQGLLELVAAATAPYGAEVPLPDAVMERPTAPYGAEVPLPDAVMERPTAPTAPGR